MMIMYDKYMRNIWYSCKYNKICTYTQKLYAYTICIKLCKYARKIFLENAQ